jgi:response regulator RpfG family c-di-GMP phosphodiesterase
MSRHRRKNHTILYFYCDDSALPMRAVLLGLGYRLLASRNGFETMEMCAKEPVDAVVLDLDRNHAEVAVIAREIKRCRPQVPTIVLAETPAADEVRALADVLVPRADHAQLVRSLQRLLTA